MSKVRYAAVSGFLIMFWVLLGKPQLDAFVAAGGELRPVIAFAVFWAGLFMAIYLMVRALGESVKGYRLHVALLSTGFLAAFDALVPPWLLTETGECVTAISDSWYMCDFQIGYILNYFMGGAIIWWIAYIVFPVTFLVILPVIFLKKKRIARLLTR